MSSKVCLVIGATGGLGRGCAEDLASSYKIVAAGRNKEKGASVVDAIKAKGGEAIFVPFDITDAASIKALHEAVISNYGRLDVAVNAAGITGPFAKMAELDQESVMSVISNNVTGVIFCMQAQIPLMQANPGGSGGRIVNFSSIFGLHGVKYGSVYAATKHAIAGLTKSAAIEYSNPKDNILINAVAPGIIVTEMTAGLANPDALPDGELKEDLKEIPKGYPMGRFGEVEDVARGVRYLIESPWVTGTLLEMDGGFGAK